MPHFKLTDANFYNGWIAADVEDDLIRHNNLAGTVMSNAAIPVPINNATIKNLKSGLVINTNLLAEYDSHPNRTGLTQFECSAPGFVTQTKVFEIKRGTTVHWDWVLVPV